MSRNLVFTSLLLAGGLSLPSGAEPFVLITSEEAARPDATATRAPRFREEGPRIQMKAPEREGEYVAPLNLDVADTPSYRRTTFRVEGADWIDSRPRPGIDPGVLSSRSPSRRRTRTA